MEGRFEAVVDGRALGWVWDPERPEETIEVEVLVDGEPVAQGRADVSRPALASAGIGHGGYGFDVSLPEHLGDRAAHTIQVLAGSAREAVAPFHQFETLVRSGHGPWQGTTFSPGRAAPPPFVPEPEDPPDPGEAALVGRRRWLFPCDSDRLSPDQLSGAPLLPGEALERRCESIAGWRRQLKELGAPYLFAVAPLKERLYRKFLPAGIELHRERPVRQLDAALRASGGGEVLDLLPALREAREVGRAHPRTGSGWSDLGAFFAYRELLREAGKRVLRLDDPPPAGEPPLIFRPGFRGDLAGKPKVGWSEGGVEPIRSAGEWEEDIDVADVSHLRALRMPAPSHLEVTERAPRLYEIAGEPDLPRAVLVGDESCLGVIPWLAEHFSRFVFLWSDELPLEAIELEAPDVVIHLIAEHRLLREP